VSNLTDRETEAHRLPICLIPKCSGVGVRHVGDRWDGPILTCCAILRGCLTTLETAASPTMFDRRVAVNIGRAVDVVLSRCGIERPARLAVTRRPGVTWTSGLTARERGLDVSRRVAVKAKLRLKDRAILAPPGSWRNSCLTDRETKERTSLIPFSRRFAEMMRQSHDPGGATTGVGSGCFPSCVARAQEIDFSHLCSSVPERLEGPAVALLAGVLGMSSWPLPHPHAADRGADDVGRVRWWISEVRRVIRRG